ncbi:uncharacterized protein BX664DRAFT_360845 [Halteromyces radiatus]|uniref:uncharacterized protein n=1 Tax=Halteromyces radiatus TaxID=101107 RepID=UPI0022207633|nr:uncharacterized protein BX664DRAFT_360845 [Halteromyces radiatus]KAI8085059.1 hypothetical protein BX664DRAFT_360845 [Halteromyces radiatus]
MDYAFYALVAICIFLLILTFYLALRRRRYANKKQAQTRRHDPIINTDYIGPSTVISDINMQPTRQDQHSPLLSEYNAMTNTIPQSHPVAAYKPEDLPQQPPPSYQDYAKDVRLLQSLPQQQHR